MKMNRRNVLVGLGGIIASGGALLGTGAFSTVEANRTVEINTEGDGAALLQINVDESYNGLSDGLGENETGGISLNFNQLNENAKTTFNSALTITNTGSNDASLEITGGPSELTFWTDTSKTNEVSSNNPVNLPSGESNSVPLTIEVNLTNEIPDNPAAVTLTATTQ